LVVSYPSWTPVFTTCNCLFGGFLPFHQINSYMWWTQVSMKGKKPPNKQLHVVNTGVHEGWETTQ
jgi:hypothetical protein